MRLLSSLILLLSSLNLFGQTKTITGKIIDELDLKGVPGIRVQTSGTSLLTETDTEGNFKIEIPFNEQSLLISGVGYEQAIINFKSGCNHLEIIIMEQATYDFISLRKVDKLRMKRFKKLPELHSTAYQKGTFTTNNACYQQPFIREFKK
jgi:hypothetical protein